MKNNFIMPFTESGITIDVCNNFYFCFENCTGYQKLSGTHFREMDLGWYDDKNDILYLIELKDFTAKNLDEEGNHQDIIWDLLKKSVDSICMLIGVLAGSIHAVEKIKPCLPNSFTNKTKIKLFHIINCQVNMEVNVGFVRDKFKPYFEGYKKLFNIDTCAIMTYNQAKKHFSDWVK